jgi:hypothetical protein
MENQINDALITRVEIKTLESLFDPWECFPIRMNEDYQKLGEIFPEDE